MKIYINRKIQEGYVDEDILKGETWDYLISSIKQQKCTAVIGPEAHVPWIPKDMDIAKQWAEEKGYPLQESYQLSRVAQFLAIQEADELYPKRVLSGILDQRRPPDFFDEQYRNTPYAVLADLKLPVYITTNYDHLMEAALESRGRTPASELCIWKDSLNNIWDYYESVFDKRGGSKYQPTVANPLVYHLHGDFKVPDSMVLTESDYIDFVIKLHKEGPGKGSILPFLIQKLLATSALLFVGYSLDEINFRIILQSLMRFITMRPPYPDICVQIADTFLITEDNEEKRREKQIQIKNYLKNYIKNVFKLNIFWGNTENFCTELRERMFGGQK